VPSCPFPEELVDEIVRANPKLARSKPPAPAAAHPPRSGSGPARAPRPSTPAQSGVYLIGFGGYVREYVMPHVRRDARAAADYKADLIRRFARPHIPVYSDTEPLLEQLAGDQRPLVIISSYHSDHASDALRVLEANPQAYVFVEKPAAVLPADADRLAELRGSGAWIDVGYNRRFAPLTAALRAELARLPRPWSLAMAVKELSIPASHWYHWANQGTRISGNACHWIDLAHFLVASPAVEIESSGLGHDVALTLRFRDGSHAALTMTERGEDLYGVTERIRVEAGDCTVELDDFRRITVNRGASSRTVARMRRDKGHDAMYRSLLERWRAALPPVYPVDDLRDVSRATWAGAELHREGKPGIRALTPSVGGRFA
jgi:predicted dehydrogenase